MKAADLNLEEIVEFSEGKLDLKGRRLVLNSLNAFAQFRRDLADSVGLDQSRRLLTRFGYFWGQADAAGMDRLFQWENQNEWLKAGARMLTLQGIAKTNMKIRQNKQELCTPTIEVVWHESGEAEEHLIEFGKVNYTVCWMLVGYASGYASYCLGREVYFIENRCRGKGDRICSATGKEKESWGKKYKSQISFYQSHDIQGKVKELTRKLRRKDRELVQHRKRLSLLERDPKPLTVEMRSTSFKAVLELAMRAAPFDSSILITGETGVGKEVLAQYIHRHSLRNDGPFVTVNCGALPETLLESELFGHKAGSFTGAIQDRIGLFEEAEKGGIFLDEIGDISPAMQLKILRVIQEKEIMRVGESTIRKVNIRIIAATNRNMLQAINEKLFRKDLYYRLRIIEIEIPPLRQRREDILPLARYFVKQLAEKLNLPQLHIDAKCLDLLQAHDWPGNVRELENALERAAILSGNGQISCDTLPVEIIHSYASKHEIGARNSQSVDQVVQEHIQAVLDHTDGNQTQAAKILGIHPATLWRKLRKTGQKFDNQHRESP